MKKILAYLLALVLLTAPAEAYAINVPWRTAAAVETAATKVVTAEPAAVEETAAAEEKTERVLMPLTYDYDELVVGTTMPMYGTFFTSMWGNDTSDIDVRNLLHGYNLVKWDSAKGGFLFDPSVVSGNVVRKNAAGDHIYSIVLHNNLRWSDGSRITAWDYAFSLLLRMDPEIEKLGGTPDVMDYLVGYKTYMDNRKAYLDELEKKNGNINLVTRAIPVLSGVRVTDDTHLQITISHSVLSFFFELGLLDCSPYPIREIAPGCTVKDDGNGVYIKGRFTSQELKMTILGENGYMMNPKVTSGPYCLVSFDGTEAVFELNKYYKGDYFGAKPTIKRIVYRLVDTDTMVDELMDCEYGLLHKITSAELIRKGTVEVAKDPRYTTANYPRSGLSFITFNMENEVFKSLDLRKAIAHSIDKDELKNDTVKDYGMRVDAYYGEGQWMYQLLSGKIPYPVKVPADDATDKEKRDYEDTLRKWRVLSRELEELPVYENSATTAVQLLVKDGWTLNLEGKTFDAEKDEVRCKLIKGVLTPLELKLVYAESATVGEALEKLVEDFAKVGIKLTVEGVDNLLDKYYGHMDRDYDMAFLATDFTILFEPSKQFEPGGAYNYMGNEDTHLYTLAKNMIRTQAGDLYGYCQKWIEFQKQFIKDEPMIPIYSNTYYDFYPRVLHRYNISNYTSWAEAIVPAYMGDITNETQTG